MSDITPTARRIARTVNANYGIAHTIYFDAGGHEVARRIGPEEFGPNDYVYAIAPTLMGPQPQHWTWRMVQDAMDEQDQRKEEYEYDDERMADGDIRPADLPGSGG